jgi:hypothetical protein
MGTSREVMRQLDEGVPGWWSYPIGRESLPSDYRDSMIPRSARVSANFSHCGIGHDFSRSASSEQNIY